MKKERPRLLHFRSGERSFPPYLIDEFYRVHQDA